MWAKELFAGLGAGGACYGAWALPALTEACTSKPQRRQHTYQAAQPAWLARVAAWARFGSYQRGS